MFNDKNINLMLYAMSLPFSVAIFEIRRKLFLKETETSSCSTIFDEQEEKDEIVASCLGKSNKGRYKRVY